jgi:hypothetical protein
MGGCAGVLLEELKITSGAEGLPPAGKEDHPYLFFLPESLEGSEEIFPQILIHGVEAIGVVEINPGNLTLSLNLHTHTMRTGVHP